MASVHHANGALKMSPSDVQAFLDSTDGASSSTRYARGDPIFRQGDRCDEVVYTQSGGVKLSVVSKTGREAVLAVLGPGDFFGEGCLAGQRLHTGSATAITITRVSVIDKRVMLRLLHTQHAMSDRFIAHMLARYARIEEDLIDQLFHSSEKRLARKLLLLARYGPRDTPIRTVPKIPQETLADMVGTTRPRVNYFLNKFKKLGFIEYDANLPIRVHRSLLNVVLQD
jgi:CRP/FNR family transcriptional regulator, cyclic AMP receptor protein